jgi:hypothetical protein
VLFRSFRVIDQIIGNYHYHAASDSQDSVNDTRYYNSSGWIYEETCTTLDATKGNGTWIKTSAKRTISLTDSNMAEAIGSYVDLVTSKSGIGWVICGNNIQWATFTFTTGGVVTIIESSLNVSSTSVDANLVIRDAGSNVRIVNELGSTMIFTIIINYTS